jgi:hypothetical protein
MGIHGAKCGGGVVAILQPKLLICSIKSHVVGVRNIKFDQELPILQSRGIKGDGITKSNALRRHLHEAAFPIVWAMKNIFSALIMIRGDRSIIKSSKALEARGWDGDSGGPVYRTGGRTGHCCSCNCNVLLHSSKGMGPICH